MYTYISLHSLTKVDTVVILINAAPCEKDIFCKYFSSVSLRKWSTQFLDSFRMPFSVFLLILSSVVYSYYYFHFLHVLLIQSFNKFPVPSLSWIVCMQNITRKHPELLYFNVLLRIYNSCNRSNLFTNEVEEKEYRKRKTEREIKKA